MAYRLEVNGADLQLYDQRDLLCAGPELSICYCKKTGEVFYIGLPKAVASWLTLQRTGTMAARYYSADVLAVTVHTDGLNALNNLLSEFESLTTWIRSITPEIEFDFEKSSTLAGVGKRPVATVIDRKRFELSGTVARVKVQREDWCVIELTQIDELGDPLVLRGPAAPGRLLRGMDYHWMGRWEAHPSYGLQFNFQTFSRAMPTTRVGLLAYCKELLSPVGFTPTRAGKLFSLYGDQALPLLSGDPTRVAHEMGMDVEKCEQAAILLREDSTRLAGRLLLYSLLGGRGFGREAVARCMQRWGTASADKIRENPFVLLEAGIPGAGFKRADKLYGDLRLPPDGLTRRAYCAWWQVESNRDGHTWHSYGDVRMRLSEYLGGRAGIQESIDAAMTAGFLTLRTHEGKAYLADTGNAQKEEYAAQLLLELLGDDRGQAWPSSLILEDLTEHQVNEYRLACSAGVGILVGSPGTGKSFMVARIVKALLSRQHPDLVGVVAPTGKAAVRMTALLHSAHVAHHATTIHRLLRPQFKGGFLYHKGNRLPHSYILLDEASMVDINLLYHLLCACGPGTRLLFVGDPFQLPPVGHGAPLRDMIRAGLPTGHLKDIHRSSGRIAAACKELREKKSFTPSPVIDLDRGENLQFVECADSAQMLRCLRGLIDHLLTRSKRGWGLVSDVQVICPTNSGGDISRDSLNGILQQILNPDGFASADSMFRVNDKIVCLKNGMFTAVLSPVLKDDRYSASMWPNRLEPHPGTGRLEMVAEFVANGDIGLVLALGPRSLVVKFVAPDRIARVPVRGTIDPDDPDETEGSFELGYAITAHKSQGAEFPVVVVMLDPEKRASFLATREWVYTALSRAKEFCCVLGSKLTLDAWCSRQSLFTRKTLLSESLKAALSLME